MIDKVLINIKSGKGGNGAKSGRREKFVPRGGPDGGDGGNGGDVYIVVDDNLNTLLGFKYNKIFSAGNGGSGKGSLKEGKRGRDISLAVPGGTQIWTDCRNPKLIYDMNVPGEKILLAKGGRGGKGNAHFATSTNQYPLLFEEGEEGEEISLRLELKLLADVGIIGAPNAGKSSLLSVVSSAQPKIASYPFTTLEPVLGVVERYTSSLVMVDIPGLIEDAHKGVGLGHDFLRHIERTRLLIHLIDGSSEDPASDYHRINNELRLFSKELQEKPQIVVINKVDIPEVESKRNELLSSFTHEGNNPLFISAATTEGVETLVGRTFSTLGELSVGTKGSEKNQVLIDIPVLKLEAKSKRAQIAKDGTNFIVNSRRACRIASMIDEKDWNARIQLYGYLRRIGIVKALEEAGISSGDTVRIGKLEWEWE